MVDVLLTLFGYGVPSVIMIYALRSQARATAKVHEVKDSLAHLNYQHANLVERMGQEMSRHERQIEELHDRTVGTGLENAINKAAMRLASLYVDTDHCYPPDSEDLEA